MNRGLPGYYVNVEVFLRRDDMHLWLAPFTEGRNHLINIDFKESSTLAMIRIWVGLSYAGLQGHVGKREVETESLITSLNCSVLELQ